MSKPIPAAARAHVVALERLFAQDAELAQRLNGAHGRLLRANDRLWSGLHPNGLAAVYGEHPAAVDVARAENRSEVLSAPDPLVRIQEVRWTIHRAHADYQAACEERRQLAADIGELIARFVNALVDAGWSEDEARNADVRQVVRAGEAG